MNRGWKIALILAGLLVLIVFGFFATITLQYWWQIRNGKGRDLAKEFSRNIADFGLTGLQGGFTPVANSGVSAVPVDLKGVQGDEKPFLGRPDAPITVVQFIDYRCPNSKASAPIMERVVRAYGYKLKFIVRNLSAEEIVPGTNYLAGVAACAQEQDKFWQMHKILFDEQNNLPQNLDDIDLKNLTDLAGADFTVLKKCLNNPATAIKVKNDFVDGVRYGARGTPTFFVNGQKVEGTVPWEKWDRFLKNL